MKSTNLAYWISTVLIFLFEGLMPALTSHTQMAIDGIRHLGYPDYFRVLLTVYKVSGTLVLVLPFFGPRLKEWAYAGLTFTFISAFVSTWATDGFSEIALFPIVVLAVLGVSYVTYHKRLAAAAKA
jgi:hypothetical protein